MTNFERPEADAAEQSRPAEEADDQETVPPAETPVDADPADVADQHRVVPVDDPYERG